MLGISLTLLDLAKYIPPFLMIPPRFKLITYFVHNGYLLHIPPMHVDDSIMMMSTPLHTAGRSLT